MDVLDAIRGRRSVRRFKPDTIEEAKIDALKDALLWAPSAGNLQSRRFLFVYKEKTKKELAEASLDQTFIAEPPLVVVACADLNISIHYGQRGVEQYATEDVACSVQNMMLAAHALDLGSVWIGAFHEVQVIEILRLPEHLKPRAIVPVGYPDESPQPPLRVRRDRAFVDVR
jgi:nitroreductase